MAGIGVIGVPRLFAVKLHHDAEIGLLALKAHLSAELTTDEPQVGAHFVSEQARRSFAKPSKHMSRIRDVLGFRAGPPGEQRDVYEHPLIITNREGRK